VKTCTPLWTAVTPSSIGGTPAVANGTVYTVSAGGTLSAFSAAGSRNCAGTAKARKCKPLWTSPTGGTGYATASSPAVANGVAYFSSTNGGTYGYDAAGSLKCSVSRGVRTCRPLWGAVTGFIGGGSPAVSTGCSTSMSASSGGCTPTHFRHRRSSRHRQPAVGQTL
jgi:outer membrane protein assembly factor BamB